METIKIKYKDKDTKRIVAIKEGDWLDIAANATYEMKAGEFQIIDLGVAMEIPEGYEAHIAPRSSTFKKWGILQTNSIGVVDHSYCGDNDWWGFPALAMRDTTIYKGDRICQFRLVKNMPEVKLKEVDTLGNPDRGGFGSSGTSAFTK